MATGPGSGGGPGGVPVGGYVLAAGEVEINAGRPSRRLAVRNTGDRPIQVGSHFHFFEVNRALDFDRPAALGMRLDIPAGTAVRFEPGVEREVDLVPFAGQRIAQGFNGLCNGSTASPRTAARALALARLYGFRGCDGSGGGTGSPGGPAGSGSPAAPAPTQEGRNR